MGLGTAVGIAVGFNRGGSQSWDSNWDKNLSRNADIVLSGGYVALGSTYDTGFNKDTETQRSLFSFSNLLRVRQTGDLTNFNLYFNKTAQCTEAFFDIWRKDGATWDVIHHVDIFSLLSAGLNDITFVTPLAVLEGDWIAISGKRTTETVSQLRSGTSGRLAYSPFYPANDLNWGAPPSGLVYNNYSLAIRVKSQAPLVVGIGDSIMAGHSAHYSFCENSETSSLANQILAQMKLLNSKYIYQNMGIGSQTSTQIAARFAADVVALKPKIVIINGGVNDIAGGTILKATFLSNYTAMFDACITANIVPVVCKILPWTGGTNEQMQTRDDWMADLETLVATYTGAVWVDFDTAIGKNRVGGDVGNLWDIQTTPDYNDDNIHLTLLGYTKMAEVIDAAITAKGYILT